MVWMAAFAAALTAAPATYGITSGDALAIQTDVDTAVAAFDVGGSTARLPNNPATFTRDTVAAKNSALVAALGICRQYAVSIQADNGVTDMAKIAAGILPRNFTRTPALVPASSPLIVIQKAQAGTHFFRFSDDGSPDSAAKPAGAVGLQIYVAIGTVAAPTPEGANFYGTFTSNGRTLTALGPIIAYDSADAGKVATIFGRWVGKRGDVGPWSLPVSMTIAF